MRRMLPCVVVYGQLFALWWVYTGRANLAYTLCALFTGLLLLLVI